MNSPPEPGAVLPTTGFWQRIDTAEDWRGRLQPPWRQGVPVALPDGRVLELPVRLMPGQTDRAVASLIANQASFEVAAQLASAMATLAAPLGADVVIGLPTLGLVFAPPVARQLGHARWVPMGYSRKFWYDEALSTTVASITTPGAGKRIYLDPNQLPLVTGRKAVVVDDAVSSGQTAARVWDLLESLGVDVIGMVVAMRQGDAWRHALGPVRASRVLGAFDSPRLERHADGWWPVAGTGA